LGDACLSHFIRAAPSNLPPPVLNENLGKSKNDFTASLNDRMNFLVSAFLGAEEDRMLASSNRPLHTEVRMKRAIAPLDKIRAPMLKRHHGQSNSGKTKFSNQNRRTPPV
jgi:hypothetical protein